MTPDGRHVVTASHDKTARVWKLTDDDTGDACRAGGEEGGGEEGGGKEGGGEKRSSEHDEESGDENEHEEAMRPARTHNPYGISSLFGLEIRVSDVLRLFWVKRIQRTRCGLSLASCFYHLCASYGGTAIEYGSASGQSGLDYCIAIARRRSETTNVVNVAHSPDPIKSVRAPEAPET